MSVRKKNIFWIITLFLIPIFVNAQNVYKPDFFPFSVWYSGGTARAPMLSEITPDSREEWRQDLEQIKSLGFNTVRTWVEWAKCEPQPGEYNFENLRLLFELTQEVGLRVFIQMYVDSAPDWVGMKHPYALFETQSGVKVQSQAAPGFCTDNEGVRQAVLNFYTQTAKVAIEYPNFYGWDLWSEPHIINWASIDYVPNVQFCYCSGTRERFRQWLESKYGTLAELNRAWYRGFEKWEDVDPPRFSTILSYTDFLDWKNFIYYKLAEDLRMRYDAVRRADKNNVITSHAAVASLLVSPYLGVGATDDFLMAEQVDFYGVSLYPKHSRPEWHWPVWRLNSIIDFTRSANRKNKGWYVGELQAGKGTIALLVSNPVTPDDHRMWIWSALAKGAKAINIYAYYPMSSGYESGGYGLIELDGTITERAVKAGEIARIVDSYQELFLKSQPVQAQIGIVYNPLSQKVGGMQRQDFPMAHPNSLIGYYRVFSENNIPVDFIHRKDLEEYDLSQYKLIILPWPIMITQEAANGIKRFVEDGGYVVAEARVGWNDERGYAAEVIPGLTLSEMFGVREKDVWMRENVEIKIGGVDHPATRRLKKGDILRGTIYAKSVDPLEQNKPTILGYIDDNLPALVTNNYGSGESLLIGSYIGLANHPEQYEGNNKFILGLADWASIERPFTTSHDGKTDTPIAVQLQKNPDGYLLFVINHSTSKQNVSINLRVKREGEYSLREIITGQALGKEAVENSLKIETTIDKRNVQVWYITE